MGMGLGCVRVTRTQRKDKWVLGRRRRTNVMELDGRGNGEWKESVHERTLVISRTEKKSGRNLYASMKLPLSSQLLKIKAYPALFLLTGKFPLAEINLLNLYCTIRNTCFLR